MQPDQLLNVAVLVSLGRHPLTGRPRRADHDARGVELALGIESQHPRTRLELVHAGTCHSENDTALRSYPGMAGLPCMTLLEQEDGADVIPALCEYLAEQRPQLVLTGCRAERGEGSGLLPYALAEQLGWPIINNLAEIEHIENGVVTVLQALPRGQRKRLQVRLPAIMSVDSAAPAPRQSAFGPARRARFESLTFASRSDDALAQWSLSPARKRPKRLKIVKSASARDRFKAAAAKVEGGSGQVLEGVSAEQGADAILKLLNEEGVLR
ncbi:electron transfer flavoprotein subunit beta [Vreelandella aquamarina]